MILTSNLQTNKNYSIFNLLRNLKDLLKSQNFKVFEKFIVKLRIDKEKIYENNNSIRNNECLTNFLISLDNLLHKFEKSMKKNVKKSAFFFKNDFKKKSENLEEKINISELLKNENDFKKLNFNNNKIENKENESFSLKNKIIKFFDNDKNDENENNQLETNKKKLKIQRKPFISLINNKKSEKFILQKYFKKKTRKKNMYYNSFHKNILENKNNKFFNNLSLKSKSQNQNFSKEKKNDNYLKKLFEKINLKNNTKTFKIKTDNSIIFSLENSKIFKSYTKSICKHDIKIK